MQREKSGVSPLFLLLPLRPSQSISQEQFAKGTVWKTSWSQWREWGLGLCYPRGADPDAGKDWGQEEKGSAEDETVGWHHWFNGHEFEQTPGDSEGQRSRACCSPWGHKESDMTECLNNNSPGSSHSQMGSRRHKSSTSGRETYKKLALKPTWPGLSRDSGESRHI